MSHYIYIYIISIALSLFGGWMVSREQRNISGFYFLLFTFFSSIWFIIYFLFFSDLIGEKYLLYVSRLGFSTGVVTVYSFLLFIYHFGKRTTKIFTKYTLLSLCIFSGIILFYLTTSYIISGLEYSITDRVYREINGPLFFLHLSFHIIFLISLVYISIKTLARQTNLDKIRLKNILLSASILFTSLIILQLILPYYFDIWILEKEIIFLFTFFVISVPVIIRRYYFSHIGYGIGKILLAILSLILSFGITEVIKYIFLHIHEGQLGYWSDLHENHFFDITSTIILYLLIHHFSKRFFLGDDNVGFLVIAFQKLKKLISRVTDIGELNLLLKDELHDICKAKTAFIEVYTEGYPTPIFSEIQYFFERYSDEKVFINDIVFIENHKEYIHDIHILSHSLKDIFLIFPLYSIGGIYIGNFFVGPKRFGDFYTLSEINALKEFSFFLEIHLKYLRTYGSLQDLSMNLDRKVDEKTIEYNNLINRQKEFISLISHEIKSPISAAIFQSDSLIHDFISKKISPEKIEEELNILNAQLVRTGGLISKLFSVQYYENHSVNLFREKVQFVQFLEYEIELFSHIYEDITFVSQIDKDIGFIKIDKIQFQQVINNLLDNAVKFVDSTNPIISIRADLREKGVEIYIEDNGKGFFGVNIENIFDKYTTGSNKNIGLGMGLYLCKEIISMHGGTIEASTSKKYGGGCFTIFLPTS